MIHRLSNRHGNHLAFPLEFEGNMPRLLACMRIVLLVRALKLVRCCCGSTEINNIVYYHTLLPICDVEQYS